MTCASPTRSNRFTEHFRTFVLSPFDESCVCRRALHAKFVSKAGSDDAESQYCSESPGGQRRNRARHGRGSVQQIYRHIATIVAPVGNCESVRLWQQLRPGTPVVALNASLDGITSVSRVYPDNAVGVELAMRRLAELGHSTAAFLSAPRGMAADTDRLRYFRRLARELGVRPVIVYSPLTITDVRKATATLLTRREAPTVIITNSDYTALGIYKTAHDLGLRIGPDVSVIGHDDLPTSELLDPPLATIRLNGQEMGRALMARLLDPDPPADFVAPVELVERASLQAPDRFVHRVFARLSATTR